MALRALTNGAASHAASALPAPLPWAAGGMGRARILGSGGASPAPLAPRGEAAPAARGAGPRGQVTYNP